MTRNAKLRQICRNYLQRLRRMADKHGLTSWLNQAIKDTKREDCEPTERECAMLSRLVDDERLKYDDVHKVIGKCYQDCIYEDDFKKIKKLRPLGRYSKVNAMLYAESLKEKSKAKK